MKKQIQVVKEVYVCDDCGKEGANWKCEVCKGNYCLKCLKEINVGDWDNGEPTFSGLLCKRHDFSSLIKDEQDEINELDEKVTQMKNALAQKCIDFVEKEKDEWDQN